jgi:hypothetical protein
MDQAPETRSEGLAVPPGLDSSGGRETGASSGRTDGETPASGWSSLLDAISDGSGTPATLDDLEALSRRVAAAIDPKAMTALSNRLHTIEDEIGLLTRMREAMSGGVVVSYPDSVLHEEQTAGDATPALLEWEERRLATLREEYEARKQAETARRPAKPSGTPARATASTLGEGSVDVALELPEPKESRPSKKLPRSPVDPRGLSLALEKSGDLTLALEALAAIPAAERTVADRYREAGLLERLSRWDQARAIFEAVAKEDKDGFFGRQAAWTLALGAKRAALRSLVDDDPGRSERSR